ncbi:PREDICTED: cytochrome b5-related protein-like, partial [Ceratosolen solmsi marchali]|uniref:Cytochrome b5-related protein-like n=1 Tax=Ceratosolen solmsi marchali TaxID=326594 RepID=A0AAJ6YXS7_9HYME
MLKIKSTVPGLNYLPAEESFLKTPYNFLESRRKNDGAEGLWRIGNNLYDLEGFMKNHPGGSEWISMTKGTDITEAFQVHHISNAAENLLPKFYVREAKIPRTISYTFDSNGFYGTFKKRAQKVLKNIDYHNPNVRSKRIADSLFIVTILLAIAVAILRSWIVIIICDNFRMYYFDLSTMSSKDWRISHGLSHHLYPNTVWDMEIYNFEPFLIYLPCHYKSFLYRLMTIIMSPITFFGTFILTGIKRYYSVFVQWKTFEFRDCVPFFIPTLMSFFTPCIWEAVKLWILILLTSSFIFSFIGVTAAHHHPKIFHDGDICRKDLDWGLMELDAVRNRKVIDDSLYLTLTNFGSHGLHHLLPSVDHAYLELCLPIFYETCKEFDIDTEKINYWELIRGQYQQLMRLDSRFNSCDKINNNIVS